jgi:hypothetical protein
VAEDGGDPVLIATRVGVEEDSELIRCQGANAEVVSLLGLEPAPSPMTTSSVRLDTAPEDLPPRRSGQPRHRARDDDRHRGAVGLLQGPPPRRARTGCVPGNRGGVGLGHVDAVGSELGHDGGEIGQFGGDVDPSKLKSTTARKPYW